MNNMQIQSEGSANHLKALKEKFETLKDKIRGNKELSAEEKTSEIDKLSRDFKKEKKNSIKNLY